MATQERGVCSFAARIYTVIERNGGVPCAADPASMRRVNARSVYGLLLGRALLTEEVAQDAAGAFAVEARHDLDLVVETLVLNDVVER